MRFCRFRKKAGPKRLSVFLVGPIIITALTLYPPQPLIASDGSPDSVPSYAEGDTTRKWTIDITSETVKTIKKEGENKVVFEGSVALTRDDTTLYADKVIMEVSGPPNHISHVEMTGNVWMTKPGLSIQAKRAQSDNLGLYVEFLEVTLTPGDLVLNKARYWFDSGKISYE